ncbi:ATP-binding cassette domain-containing protein [Bifidobacterium mongoliense]|nr:ATP-binding cassette domain-containing protein [Bifidobacterium mongoliense]
MGDGGGGVVSGVVSHTAAVAALTVRHLWCAYGDGEPWVIKDCSWTVPAGSLTVLAGASGSGKSTLLSCIAGLAAHEPTMRWRAACSSMGCRIQDGPFARLRRRSASCSRIPKRRSSMPPSKMR